MSTDSTTLLGRHPVLWTSAFRALLPLAVLFGAPLSPEQTAGIFLAFEAVLALLTRASVTPNAAVAERVTSAGQVVAGPANDLATEGHVVRHLGES